MKMSIKVFICRQSNTSVCYGPWQKNGSSEYKFMALDRKDID